MSGLGPLFERDREIEVLEHLVAGAQHGEAALVLLEGPAGIGKTRLLTGARDQARSAGFRVVAARGSEFEREVAYGVVRQLFESLVQDPDQRDRLLRGPAAGAMRVFAPPDEDHALGPNSFDVLHGLFWLTAHLAGDGPLCVVVDDLHWCDQASLRFLGYLEHRLEGLAVLVVTAARMGEPGPESELVLGLAEDERTVPIRLAALSEAGVAEMVRDGMADDAEAAFCAACHHASGGNPLLLRELVKTLQAEHVSPDAAHAHAVREVGPRAVSRTVLLRLSRLSADAVEVARAVALLGDGVSLPATAALADLDEDRVARATRNLVASEILRPDAPLGFVHAMVRDAVYLELSISERQVRHLRAARELAALGATSEVVASQLLLVPSHGDAWVAGVLREAGSLAMRRGDAYSAVAYLRRALEEGPADADRVRMLWELGAAEARVDSEASAERLRQVQDDLDDPLQRALAADVLARSLLWTRPAHEAVTVAQRAVAELGSTHADQRRALEATELYAVFFGGVQVPDWQERLDSVRAAGMPDRLGAKMLAAVAAWDWALGDGTADECAGLALGLLADGALIARDPGFGAAVAGAVLGLADHEEAPRVWQEAMSSSRRLGSQPYICSVNLWSGWTWLQRGRLPEAEAALREASEQLQAGFGDNGPSLAYGSGLLGRTLVERGDLAGARKVLSVRGRPNPGSDGDTLIRRADVELLLAEGRWQEAAAAAADLGGDVESPARSPGVRAHGTDNPAWVPWRSLLARALDGLGRQPEAIALVDTEIERARRWGAPGAIAASLRWSGVLHADDGLELLQEAVSAAEASPARLEHAKALVAWGSALRGGGARSEARDPLARGLELAQQSGATALADTARSELYAAGGRPRKESLTGPESLTPSERRIADLAAEGLTTRDIAQALFVTPRTVEGHLTNVYRKLGIATRTALAGALGGTPSP
jgi:DNA-binding CsgD family transcriptional regulator